MPEEFKMRLDIGRGRACTGNQKSHDDRHRVLSTTSFESLLANDASAFLFKAAEVELFADGEKSYRIHHSRAIDSERSVRLNVLEQNRLRGRAPGESC
jgi:hypothetical protein